MYDSAVRVSILYLLLLGACAHPGPQNVPVAIRSAGPHSLTNPILDVEAPLEYRELGPMRRSFEAIVASHTASQSVRHVSIYFRDLNNGPWLGINQNERFSPASLFKVPIMMALLKQAESQPSILSTRLIDAETRGLGDVAIVPTRSVEARRSYSVEELIILMIAESDNNALSLLLDVLDRKVFNDMFTEFGLAPPDLRVGDSFMKVRDYASFFRILYNASYLSRAMSEKALDVLTKVDFREALAADIPLGVTVAHKFGERIISDSNEIQLHDCGIIYRPRRPYILCVMTRGARLEGLKAFIREVSATAFAAQAMD